MRKTSIHLLILSLCSSRLSPCWPHSLPRDQVRVRIICAYLYRCPEKKCIQTSHKKSLAGFVSPLRVILLRQIFFHLKQNDSSHMFMGEIARLYNLVLWINGNMVPEQTENWFTNMQRKLLGENEADVNAVQLESLSWHIRRAEWHESLKNY